MQKAAGDWHACAFDYIWAIICGFLLFETFTLTPLISQMDGEI